MMGTMQGPARDDRQRIAVTPASRVFILAEMRNMLAAVQQVAEASGSDNWAAAAQAASRSSMKTYQGMPRQVMKELPEDFREMGRQSHMAFDAISEAAIQSHDPLVVSANLGEALQYYVACHGAYRFAGMR